MKLFSCSACRAVVFFESVRCESCGKALLFAPDRREMVALDPDAPPAYRACANAAHDACNWAVPVDSADALCRACELNETIPNLSEPGAVEAWRKIELAKRRLLFSLHALGLAVVPRTRAETGLAFAFLRGGSTGHVNGLVTIDIAEADSPKREKIRIELGETYRTLLGHFRHEIGHYFWQLLVANRPIEGAFRAMFGDERADYAAAQKRHYEGGPPADWRAHFVSAYASMHPWEDWAETWAHYLHMVDTLQTARSYGLALRPAAAIAPVVTRALDFDDFDDLVAAWIPLTIALNSLNRSMGLPDLYAFVLSNDAIAKLRFVHDVIESASRVTGQI